MIEILEIKKDMLAKYSLIPIAFEVKTFLKIDLLNDGLDGVRLSEEKVNNPYLKNNDEPNHGPENWPMRFNLDNWGMFVAAKDGIWVGGMALAYRTPNVHMLEGKNDMSVLWDLRVHPDYQRLGIGRTLIEHAVAWSKERSCKRLKIETQSINVNACKFYKKQGCKLGAINRYAYEDYPNEVQLIWYYETV